jgi:hypothetical protein
MIGRGKLRVALSTERTAGIWYMLAIAESGDYEAKGQRLPFTWSRGILG